MTFEKREVSADAGNSDEDRSVVADDAVGRFGAGFDASALGGSAAVLPVEEFRTDPPSGARARLA